MGHVVCSYDTYHDLIKKCSPKDYFTFIEKELIPSIQDYDEETADEVKDWVRCTSGWLNQYMKFATNCMSDRELNAFYNNTLSLIQSGIESRNWQKERVDDELLDVKELWYDEVITDEEWGDAKWIASEIKNSLDEDIKKLKKLYDFCVKAKDRIGVVRCIEKVANMSHSRGSMLPVMCGAYLPEDIYHAATGHERWGEYVDPAEVGLELSRTVPHILDCIKDYKGPQGKVRI